jgi:predicted ester cyclase
MTPRSTGRTGSPEDGGATHETITMRRGADSMGAEENLVVHASWAEAEGRHDFTHHHDYLHEDVEVHIAGRGPVVGFDAYLALLEETYVALEDYHVTLLDRFATDDRLACRWTNSGIHVGELNGMAATGKELEWAGVSVWEFDNDKARRGWAFQDFGTLMTQLMG